MSERQKFNGGRNFKREGHCDVFEGVEMEKMREKELFDGKRGGRELMRAPRASESSKRLEKHPGRGAMPCDNIYIVARSAASCCSRACVRMVGQSGNDFRHGNPCRTYAPNNDTPPTSKHHHRTEPPTDNPPRRTRRQHAAPGLRPPLRACSSPPEEGAIVGLYNH